MRWQAILPFRRRRERGTYIAGFALAGLAGAAAAALLEPRGGARRRGLVVQKAVRAGKVTRSFGEKAGRDLANRSRGLFASARSRAFERDVADEVLAERVRSRMGRLTSHPSAIEVVARGGVVELHGPVLEAEAEQVLGGVRRVRGARDVVDRLERHETPGSVPGLQGGAGRPGPVPELLQENWGPGTRVLTVGLGVGLAATMFGSRLPGTFPVALLGALLALRGATNLPLKRLVGVGARRLLEHGKAEGVTREELRH